MANVPPQPWGSLTFRTEERAEAVVLSPSGEVDLGTAPALRSSLKAILEDGHNAIVDLGAITYIDSTGIKVVFDMHRLFLERGRRVVLAEPATVVRKVMEIVGLEKAVPVYASLDAALQSFHTSPWPPQSS